MLNAFMLEVPTKTAKRALAAPVNNASCSYRLVSHPANMFVDKKGSGHGRSLSTRGIAYY
jgi:hypothetical protein